MPNCWEDHVVLCEEAEVVAKQVAREVAKRCGSWVTPNLRWSFSPWKLLTETHGAVQFLGLDWLDFRSVSLDEDDWATEHGEIHQQRDRVLPANNEDIIHKNVEILCRFVDLRLACPIPRFPAASRQAHCNYYRFTDLLEGQSSSLELPLLNVTPSDFFLRWRNCSTTCTNSSKCWVSTDIRATKPRRRGTSGTSGSWLVMFLETPRVSPSLVPAAIPKMQWPITRNSRCEMAINWGTVYICTMYITMYISSLFLTIARHIRAYHGFTQIYVISVVIQCYT